MTDKEIYNLLPQEIKDILYQSKGWIVGSSIKKLINHEYIRDYDILISDAELYAKTIAVNKIFFDKFTTFGGIKFKINDLTIDIWYQNLEDFIDKSTDTGIMYNLIKNKTLILNDLNDR